MRISGRVKVGIVILAFFLGYNGLMVFLEFKDNCERAQYENTHRSIDWDGQK